MIGQQRMQENKLGDGKEIIQYKFCMLIDFQSWQQKTLNLVPVGLNGDMNKTCV